MRKLTASGMRRVDERLIPANPWEAECPPAAVVSELQGVVRLIVHRKIGSRFPGLEIDDISSDVIMKVLERLQTHRANPEVKPIADLRGYTAVVAYNACRGLIRRGHPRRWRLKNRIRYVLTRLQGFALWEAQNGKLLCGLDRRRSMNVADQSRLRVILNNRALAISSALDEATIQELRRTLKTVLEQAGDPVELEVLVKGLAEAQGFDKMPESMSTDALDAVADSRADFATRIERRSCLERLWREIGELPLRQRTALLLNLRDLRDGVIALLPLTGIASIRQIAEVLEIPAIEFAKLWNELPIDDATIARRLGLTAQQVINVRKSARERLARRMRRE